MNKESFLKTVKKYTLRILLCIFIPLVFFFALTLESSTSAPVGSESSNLISDLRSMKAAALMFYENNQNSISEVPRGINNIEYIGPYMDNPAKFSNKSPYIFIINGDNWWVGYNMKQARKSESVRNRLADKAIGIGLYGSFQSEPPLAVDQAFLYKESDGFAWMFVFNVIDRSFLELCKAGTLQEVEDAIKAGANVNAVPLMFGVINNANLEVTQLLIDNGADVNTVGQYGRTTLMSACGGANEDVVRMLIENGADVNAVDSSGRTPLSFAAKFNANAEVVRILIDNGADVNAKDKDGKTPLIDAVISNNNENIVQLLINNGADVNIVTEFWSGYTALMYAAEFNVNLEVVTMLIKNGADVNTKTQSGKTALILAASSNSNPKVITALIENGADVNAWNQLFGMTALMWAAHRNSNPEVIYELLKAGADVKLKDSRGRMAIDYARNNKYLKDTYALRELNDRSY